VVDGPHLAPSGRTLRVVSYEPHETTRPSVRFKAARRASHALASAVQNVGVDHGRSWRNTRPTQSGSERVCPLRGSAPSKVDTVASWRPFCNDPNGGRRDGRREVRVERRPENNYPAPVAAHTPSAVRRLRHTAFRKCGSHSTAVLGVRRPCGRRFRRGRETCAEREWHPTHRARRRAPRVTRCAAVGPVFRRGCALAPARRGGRGSRLSRSRRAR